MRYRIRPVYPKKIAAVGNIYRHNYDDVQQKLVWSTIHDDLPALFVAVEVGSGGLAHISYMGEAEEELAGLKLNPVFGPKAGHLCKSAQSAKLSVMRGGLVAEGKNVEP